MAERGSLKGEIEGKISKGTGENSWRPGKGVILTKSMEQDMQRTRLGWKNGPGGGKNSQRGKNLFAINYGKESCPALTDKETRSYGSSQGEDGVGISRDSTWV